jgi:rSAM/selenodomain-associated transferase 2
VALPFVMQRSNRLAWPAFVLAWVSVVPFVNDSRALFHSLFIFGGQMHYNDMLPELLRFLFGPAALPVLGFMLAGILTAIYLFEHDTLRSVYLAVGSVLLCLPTLHPWYLVLITPFMVLHPSRAWLFFMLTTIVTLPVVAIEYRTGVFQEIRWLKLLEYLPFYGVMVYDVIKRRSLLPRKEFPEPQSLSVVMPVLNEERRIAQAVQVVRAEPDVMEIIVVDGGSNDLTREKARQNGARVVSGPRGRGRQVKIAADRSKGDVILVLHADTALLPGSLSRMRKALTDFPAIAGGAFGMVFEKPSCKLRLVAWLNNVRARWFGIAFGDQGQFFRRAALDTMGGFPDLMLMEDVELSLRLKGVGRPLFIPSGVRVSARRWERRGYAGNIGMVLKLFASYLVERRFKGAGGLCRGYYRKYYGRP